MLTCGEAEDEGVDALESFHDLDSTDQFEVLRDVPESEPSDEEAIATLEPDSGATAEPIVPPGTMPAAVAATVAGIAGKSTAVTRPADEKPALSPMSARWRRPAEPDESFRMRR